MSITENSAEEPGWDYLNQKSVNGGARHKNLPTIHPRTTEPVPDVVRKNSNLLSQRQTDYMLGVQDAFNLLIDRMNDISTGLGSDRMMALARTKAEESCMWAVKSITRFIPAESADAYAEQDEDEQNTPFTGATAAEAVAVKDAEATARANIRREVEGRRYKKTKLPSQSSLEKARGE